MQDLDNFRDKEEKDPAKFFETIESLSKKLVEEKLNENPNFLFMCLMMKRGKAINLLSETDYILLKKVITTSDGDINGINEELLEETKNEFERLKIEGQRTNEQNAHFTQNNQRFYGYNRPSRKPFKFVPSNTKNRTVSK